MDSDTIRSLRAVKPVAIDSGKGKRTNSFAINTTTGLIISISNEGKLVYVLSKNKLKKSPQLSSANEKALSNILQLTDGSGRSDKYFYDEFIKHKFNNINFSDDGSSLVVWSSNSVGIISLSLAFQHSAQVYDDSKFLECCKFTLLMTNLPQQGTTTQQSYSTSNIVKSCFHPFSSHHIVTLYERGLLVVTDIISVKSTKIPLSREYSFVSFCFGPQVDWMTASIFLLERKGDIFILCPVLPYACQMPESSREDMYMWLEEQRNDGVSTSGVDNNMQKYIYHAKEYLMSAFSHIGHDSATDDEEDIDDDEIIQPRSVSKNSSLVLLLSEEHPVLAGVVYSTLPSRISFSADHHRHLGQTTSPIARSPYTRQQQQQISNPDDNRNAKLRSSSIMGGSLADSSGASVPALQGPLRFQRKSKQQQRIAVDICVPSGSTTTSSGGAGGNSGTTSTAAPVIVICFSNGDVESFLIGGGSTASSSGDAALQSVGPCWLMAEEELDSDGGSSGVGLGSIRYPCPGLLSIESIPLAQSLVQTLSQPPSHPQQHHHTWLLTPDRVNSHCIHVTSQEDCASFIISLKWLASVLESQKALYQEELIQQEQEQRQFRDDDTEDDDNDNDGVLEGGIDYFDYSNNVGGKFSATKPGRNLQQTSLRQYNDNNYPSSPSSSLPSASLFSPYRSSPLVSPMHGAGYNNSSAIKSRGGRRSSLDSIDENGRNSNSNKYNNAYNMNARDADGDDGDNGYNGMSSLQTSLVIPVFCPLSNGQQNQPFITTSSSTGSQSSSSDSSTMTLSGMSVSYDTLRGHYAIFQTNTGLVASINLTAHMQFCESQFAFQQVLSSSSSSTGGSSGGLDLKVTQRQQQLHEESLAKLLQTAIAGLSVVPVSPTVAAMKVTDVNDTKSPAVVAVHRARSHLDTEVCLPLHEAGQRLKYRLESLKDTYKIQMELIAGGTQSASVTAANTPSTAASTAAGVKNQIKYFEEEREEILIRLEAMRNKCEEQKERMEDALRVITLLKSKITPAERNYHQTLSTWSQTAVQLEAKLLQLQNQSEALNQQQQQLLMAAEPQTPKSSTAAATSSVPVTPNSVTTTGIAAATATPKVSSMSVSSSFIKKPKPFTFTTPSAKKQPQPPQPPQDDVSMTTPVVATTPTQTTTSAFKRYTSESMLVSSNSRTPSRGILSPQQQQRPVAAVMTQEDIDICLKLQSSQTEMLRAGVEELKELEMKLHSLRRKFAV